MKYLIWSNEHNAWWRAGRAGYTRELDAAGRYGRDEAIKQCAWGRDGWGSREIPSELPVSEADADECLELFKKMHAQT